MNIEEAQKAWVKNITLPRYLILLGNVSLGNATVNQDGVVVGATYLGVPIPAVKSIDSKILNKIGNRPDGLEMVSWHTCDTTHCRGGWAIHLAGTAGLRLENRSSQGDAAAMIYAMSRPGKDIPDFYTDNDAAMESIIADAASERADRENV